jgi:hypothetical protein
MINKKILEYKIEYYEPKNINHTYNNLNKLNIIYFNKYQKYKNKYLYLKY